VTNSAMIRSYIIARPTAAGGRSGPAKWSSRSCLSAWTGFHEASVRSGRAGEGDQVQPREGRLTALVAPASSAPRPPSPAESIRRRARPPSSAPRPAPFAPRPSSRSPAQDDLDQGADSLRTLRSRLIAEGFRFAPRAVGIRPRTARSNDSPAPMRLGQPVSTRGRAASCPVPSPRRGEGKDFASRCRFIARPGVQRANRLRNGGRVVIVGEGPSS